MVRIKVKAFSLFESVVAISIITICIGIGALIYSNLINSDKPMLVLEAREEMKHHFHDLKQDRLYINQSFDHEIYFINQKVSPYKGNKLIYEVEYEIEARGKIIESQKYLLVNEEI